MTLLHACSLLGFPVCALMALGWRRSDVARDARPLLVPFAVGTLWLGTMLGLYLTRLLPWEIVAR